jgi:hypothetical protein
MVNTSSINYKQIVADLSSIAYHHQQIKSFGFGDLAQCTNDIVTKQEPEYQRMYVVPGDVKLDENYLNYRFSIIIMDRVDDDQSNQAEVMSDTLRTIMDVWTVLLQSYTAQQGDFSWYLVVNENPDVIPFLERFETILGGWTLNVSFQVAFDYNSCTPPVTGNFQFPEDQQYNSYKYILDEFQEFANLHQQVNSYGFGDIEQLTNDIITKQEPEYPRMYVLPDITLIQRSHIHLGWRVFFVDKLNNDISNFTDVLSDQLEIVKDFFAKLYLSDFDAGVEANVIPFYEKTETILSGWIIEFHFIQKYDYDRCVLPVLPFTTGLTWAQVSELWKNVSSDWKNV